MLKKYIFLGKNHLLQYFFFFFVSIFLNYFSIYDISKSLDYAYILSDKINLPKTNYSPFVEFVRTSFSSLNLIIVFLLNLNLSDFVITKILGTIGIFFFMLGLFFICLSLTKDKVYSIIISVCTVLFSLHIGSTNYPVLFFYPYHSGIISNSIAVFILGLIFKNYIKAAIILNIFLISLHLVVGLWVALIFLLSFLLEQYLRKIKINFFIFFIIFILSVIFYLVFILIYKFTSIHLDVNKDIFNEIDWDLIRVYISKWDWHRQIGNYWFYYIKSFFLLGGIFLIIFLEKKRIISLDLNIGLIYLTLTVSLSFFLYLIFKQNYLTIPIFFNLPMPLRVTMLHSIYIFPIFLSYLYNLVKIKKISIRNVYLFVFSLFLIFIFIRIIFFKPWHRFDLNKITNISISQDKIFKDEIDINFWNKVKKLKNAGYALTTEETSFLTIIYGRKATLIDASGIDIMPYAPITATQTSKIIERIYGINFYNPQQNFLFSSALRSKDNSIKNNFESYDINKWRFLSEEFKFDIIIVPVDWKLKIRPIIKGNKYSLIFIGKDRL